MPLTAEEELREYIAFSRSSVRVAAEERGAIKESITNLANMYTLHEQKDEARHLEVTGMLKGHEARISLLERDAEDTGSWVRTHGGRLVREDKRRKWWTTRIAKLGFKVAEWAIIAALAAIGAHLAWR